MGTLAIDVDGTLVVWAGDQETRLGAWLPGAIDALHDLARNYQVVLHSCRFTWKAAGGWEPVGELLADAGFRPHLADWDSLEGRYLWTPTGYCGRPEAQGSRIGMWLGRGKPVAMWYIDDRGVEFRGDWPSTLARLKAKEMDARLGLPRGAAA